MNRWGSFLSILALGLLLISCGSKDELTINSIALFTDYDAQSPYVAQLKGSIKSINPNVEIIDLLHSSESLPTYTASYLLDKSARYFPEGTAFVIEMDTDVNSQRKPILVRTKADKVYLCKDNTILTRVIHREGIKEAIELNKPKYFRVAHPSSIFQGRDIFGPVAAHLSLGKLPKEIGVHMPKIDGHPINSPTILNSNITAEIVHIDRAGNVITNVHSRDVKALKPGQLVRLIYKGKTRSVPFLKDSSDLSEERLIAWINSDGELEISFIKKSAAAYLKAKPGDSILIKY